MLDLWSLQISLRIDILKTFGFNRKNLSLRGRPIRKASKSLKFFVATLAWSSLCRDLPALIVSAYPALQGRAVTSRGTMIGLTE